jgi:sugar lactone lactonase YvrE
MDYRKVQVIAGRGEAPGRFAESLRGLAVDAQDRLYAVGDSKVVVFSPGGAVERSWATKLPGYCVAVAPDGTVYVGQEGQVQLFAADGTPGDTWRDGDRLGVISSIGLTDDAVLLGDATARCIHRYERSSTKLNSSTKFNFALPDRFVSDIGKNNRMRGFMLPNGHMDFAVDGQAVIHAAHSGKHRVERYDLDGKLLGQFGRFDGTDPVGFPGCCNPTNLALTVEGQVVVTEKASPRVKVYDADGKLRAHFGEQDFDANCRNMDVAVDTRGRVYVIDTVRLQVVVYNPEDVAATQPTTAATQRVQP